MNDKLTEAQAWKNMHTKNERVIQELKQRYKPAAADSCDDLELCIKAARALRPGAGRLATEILAKVMSETFKRSVVREIIATGNLN